MQLPDSVKAIRARYVQAYPVPQGAPGDAFEESARQWSIRFAEQVAFDLQYTSDAAQHEWGMKRADPNRPISKDTLARRDMRTGELLIWDLLSGTGTGSPRLVDNPDSQDVTGQTFVPVTPTNHLGTPSQPPANQPPLVDLVTIGQKLDTLTAYVDGVVKIAASLDEKIDALSARYQAHTEDFASLGGKIDALAAIKIPDADIRLYGRTVGKVDFPGND